MRDFELRPRSQEQTGENGLIRAVIVLPSGASSTNRLAGIIFSVNGRWKSSWQLCQAGPLAESAGTRRLPHRVAPTAGLFLDMPLGVHPGGYDTWRWPSLFVDGVIGRSAAG